jgi:hypothetical protein
MAEVQELPEFRSYRTDMRIFCLADGCEIFLFGRVLTRDFFHRRRALPPELLNFPKLHFDRKKCMLANS